MTRMFERCLDVGLVTAFAVRYFDGQILATSDSTPLAGRERGHRRMVQCPPGRHATQHRKAHSRADRERRVPAGYRATRTRRAELPVLRERADDPPGPDDS